MKREITPDELWILIIFFYLTTVKNSIKVTTNGGNDNKNAKQYLMKDNYNTLNLKLKKT